MKIYVSIVLDNKTKEPKKVEVFKAKKEAEQYLIKNHSFNMPVERTI